MAYFPFDQSQQIDLPAALAAEGGTRLGVCSTGVSTGLRQMGHLRGRIMAGSPARTGHATPTWGRTPPRLQRLVFRVRRLSSESLGLDFDWLFDSDFESDLRLRAFAKRRRRRRPSCTNRCDSRSVEARAFEDDSCTRADLALRLGLATLGALLRRLRRGWTGTPPQVIAGFADVIVCRHQ